jgi:hypothetical protein
MTELTAPIVGMHFRPPAKEVVNLLPPNTRVLLRREPTNEYDEFAVQVLLPGFNTENDTPAGDVFRTLLESDNYGEDVLFEETASGVFDRPKDPLHLAFVDSKKTGMARMFSQAMLFEERQKQQDMDGDLPDKLLYFEAKLTFDLAGKPQVVTELKLSEDQYEHALDDDELEELEFEDEEEDGDDAGAIEPGRHGDDPGSSN